MSKKFFIVSIFGFLLFSFSLAIKAEETIPSLQTQYQTEMANYRKESANFEREKQLYFLHSGDRNLALANVLRSAQATLLSRKKTILYYSQYLEALVNKYLINSEKTIDLQTQLVGQQAEFAKLEENFDNLTDWYRQDTNFATIMTKFNQTTYQAFSWIYWDQLQKINNEYQELLSSQKTRILAEAPTEIIREQKKKLIEQSERESRQLSLNLQAQIEKRNQVNSYESYLSFKNNLDRLQAQLQASLQTYAQLE